jgi:hypothetical protein
MKEYSYGKGRATTEKNALYASDSHTSPDKKS